MFTNNFSNYLISNIKENRMSDSGYINSMNTRKNNKNQNLINIQGLNQSRIRLAYIIFDFPAFDWTINSIFEQFNDMIGNSIIGKLLKFFTFGKKSNNTFAFSDFRECHEDYSNKIDEINNEYSYEAEKSNTCDLKSEDFNNDCLPHDDDEYEYDDDIDDYVEKNHDTENYTDNRSVSVCKEPMFTEEDLYGVDEDNKGVEDKFNEKFENKTNEEKNEFKNESKNNDMYILEDIRRKINERLRKKDNIGNLDNEKINNVDKEKTTAHSADGKQTSSQQTDDGYDGDVMFHEPNNISHPEEHF